MGGAPKKIFGSIPVIGDVVQGLETEDLAKKSAKQREAEARESRRRLARQQRANIGEARARAGASGVKTTGSTAAFIEDLAESYRAELAWLEKSGASAADAERRRGELASMGSYSRAFSNAISLAAMGYDMGWFSGGGGGTQTTGLARPSGDYQMNYGPR